MTAILILSSWIIAFLVQCIFYLPCLVLPKHTQHYVHGHIFRKIQAVTTWINPFWSLKIHGKVPEIPEGSIIMSNHLSNADAFMLCTALFPYESKYIAKSDLFKTPFGGWAMSLSGDVPIYFTKEKGGWGTKKGSIKKMMTDLKERLAKGTKIAVFPEGVRSKTGEMSEFKQGMFMLAAETGATIVPVAMGGCQNCWPVGSSLLDTASVHVKFGQPIKVKVGEDYNALNGKVRDTIATMANTLPNEDK